MLGFAGRHGDHFDAHVARDDERQRQPDAAPAVRQEPARTVEQVAESGRRPGADAGDEREADER